MPFTPKFVDLVKNITMVQGTGPVSMDLPVTGFTSFANACAPGDQFYYCIQGIDKPAEREVGRGTMQGDGTVARDPISGASTNFTKGKKSIALVAAAEWMKSIQDTVSAQASPNGDRTFVQMAGAGVPGSQSRVETVGYHQEGVGSAVYIHDSAVDAAYVAARPYSSFLVADGRGFRLDPAQAIRASMWGVKTGDNSAPVRAENLARLKAALEYKPVAGNDWATPVTLDYGDTYISGTLEPNAVFTLRGEGSFIYNAAMAGKARSRLIAPTNTTVIRIKERTLGLSGPNVVGQTSAGGSVIKGLWIAQDTLGNDLAAHGIHARATPMIEDCIFENIAGHGVAIIAYTGDNGALYGNANIWKLFNCQVHSCGGNALHVQGSDANAGYCRGFDTRVGVQGCGIRDAAYLFNEYHGVHLAGYGASGVQHGGYAWQLITDSNSGTAPGTNENIWYRLGPLAAPNATFTAWDNATTYRARLPYLIGNGALIEGYEEYGATIGHGGRVIGTMRGTKYTNVQGLHNEIGLVNSRGLGRYREGGGDPNWAAYPNVGNFEEVSIGGLNYGNGDDGRSNILHYRVDNGGPKDESFSFVWQNNSRVAWVAGLRGLATIEGRQTTETFGRSTPQPGTISFAGYALSPYLGNGSDDHGYPEYARKHHASFSGPPTGGNHARDEFVWNLASNAYPGIIGWRCAVAGTPGVWVPLTTFSPVGNEAGTAYGFVLADGGSYKRFTAAGAVTVTIPTEASQSFPIGSTIEVEQAGAGVVTVAAAGGVTVSSRGGKVATAGQFAVAKLKKVAADSWTLTGDLA